MFHATPSLINSNQPIRTEQAHIEPGRYIDIDERIYQQQPALLRNFVGGVDTQFGGVNVKPRPFIDVTPQESLRVNYGTYLFNQTTNRF